VTSPGGITEKGTAALEEHGLRAAFDAAVDAAVGA
jgi:pyrroline-5-carboxylate reductase